MIASDTITANERHFRFHYSQLFQMYIARVMVVVVVVVNAIWLIKPKHKTTNNSKIWQNYVGKKSTRNNVHKS